MFKSELMTPGSREDPLSAITIQSLADLGYSVDVTQAEPYTLPSAAKASAKIAAQPPLMQSHSGRAASAQSGSRFTWLTRRGTSSVPCPGETAGRGDRGQE